MRRRVLAAQNVSRMCAVCGRENAWSLKARFLELEGDELLAIFTPLPEHQGYPGRLHGGIASALLDETIGRAIQRRQPDRWGVTIDLNLRYRRPIPIGGELRALARITRDTSRMFEGRGEIVLVDGTVAVEARGRYLKTSIGQITDVDFSQQWFADPQDAPSQVFL
jgi:uncharacterized protein (TIGR00369 family)